PTSVMMQPKLEAVDHVSVDGLTIAFRDSAGRLRHVVNDVSFSLGRGETLGIVGESGSGKSTIARALMAYMRPGAQVLSGKVKVAQQDIFGLRDTALRCYRGQTAALVPQNPLSSLTPHMTILAQMREVIVQNGRRHGAQVDQRAFDLLERTGLPEPSILAKRYPHELSGGQRQRVVIAAALAGEPELIILDEPTTALDKTVEARVLDLVAEFQQRLGTTLVYVSHDLNVIRRMCRRVLVMRDGAMVEGGATEQVFRYPRSDYARELVLAIPKLEAKATRQPPDRPAHLRLRDMRFCHNAGGSRLAARIWKRTAPPSTLQDISFDLLRGSTLGIVGESGSGKSTLASLIAGALSGHDGRMQLDNEPLSGLARNRPIEHRRAVQMVFQDPLSSLNPCHSVAELITRPLMLFFAMTRAAARARARDLLEEMELPSDLLERYPRQLSGGQQQRVAIARAFACEPELLICDEITSALDVTVQAQVIAMMQRLQRDRGTSYIFISHDLPVVARMSDRVLVLSRGRVMDNITPTELIEGQGSQYSRTLLAAFRANVSHSDVASQRNPKNVN
ncbi:nickel ABC transporter ATP-binding protein NikE, partial [Roseinatronobacter sp. NSM]|uniref:nickel ABC transporter ATP-binding protein NikE n=1 Tax=Roseinatronobacter sp. NSM TaxID=3457785 RepID=UPI004037147C